MTMTDPLHQPSGPHTVWTTVNTGENFPNVATPLGWTFWRDGMDLGCKGGFCDLGALPKREVRTTASADDASFAAVYGRFAANVTWLRRVADFMPGTSGNALEEQMFGAKPGQPDTSTPRRYAIVVAKLPVAALRLPKQIRAMRAEQHDWWSRVTAPGAIRSEAEARDVLREAAGRFARAMRPHTVSGALAIPCYQAVASVAAAAGHPELTGTLVAGGGAEETETVAALWRVSRDELSLEEFLRVHGYHSGTEAEIATVAWREDPAPVRRLVQTYRQRPEANSPAAGQARTRADRAAAEALVLASLPRHRRALAKAALAVARRYIPLREVGKATFVQAIDGGRCAARELGRRYAERGLIDKPDDIYMLTLDELTGALPGDLPALVEQRRALYERYRSFELPERWAGDPEKLPVEGSGPAGGPLAGLGVSPGVVEGTVRVVDDPDDLDLDDGEILVCHTTDPSWAALFLIAGGLIIDVGGPMSHGAIVAREMGIPCVINTRVGTKTLKTGDEVRINGVTGTVELLSRPTQTPAES